MGQGARRALGTILASCAALAMAGCGATQATMTPGSGSASRSVGPPGKAAATPRQRAEADAAAILRAFVPPPGARRLAKAPPPPDDLVGYPGSASTAQVEDVSWWRAPGTPDAVLAWEKSHLPGRFSPAGGGFGSDGGMQTDSFSMFRLPAVPGVLNSRYLVVYAIATGGGQTAIRAYAQVNYQPPRPPGERMPSAARAVTITALASPVPGAKRPPAPVTITGATAVRRIIALIDSLPLSTVGRVPCPSGGAGMQLTFRARSGAPGGPPLATAQGGPCWTLLVTIGGRQQPALAITTTFTARVLTIAGLHWKLS
jgi:hypothetical protein